MTTTIATPSSHRSDQGTALSDESNTLNDSLSGIDAVVPTALELAEDENLYGYVGDNPINRVDPSGLAAAGPPDQKVLQANSLKNLLALVTEWTQQGVTVAAKNLAHFLDKTGTDLHYDGGDIAHIRSLSGAVQGDGSLWTIPSPGVSIDQWVQGDLMTKVVSHRARGNVKGSGHPRWVTGELFYAFGGLQVDYDADVKCVGRGFEWTAKVKISDHYTFLNHSSFASNFANFYQALILEGAGLAKGFWDYGEWTQYGKATVSGRAYQFELK